MKKHARVVARSFIIAALVTTFFAILAGFASGHSQTDKPNQPNAAATFLKTAPSHPSQHR